MHLAPSGTKEIPIKPPELVVFSHLRWDFVWQRPQHIVSRLAGGLTTWFVEEPLIRSDIHEPRLRRERRGPVERIWLEVPGEGGYHAFGDDVGFDFERALVALVGPGARPMCWLYTPMALPFAEALNPRLLIYDVMDDLASFAVAAEGMVLRQRQVLAAADVVFTGGRSLHRGVAEHCNGPVHLLPSGVEPEHYAGARQLRGPRDRPVAGYVGVIDERLDLELIAGLARRLPHWRLEMVGPTLKIDEDALPRADNIHYMGFQPYDRLPEVMAGFDVALMPFAINRATRSISPTKTLEYVAAGLPVVSTRVPDVVSDYGDIVDLQEDADGFAGACDRVLRHELDVRDDLARAHLLRHHWDTIASAMRMAMDDALNGGPVAIEERSA